MAEIQRADELNPDELDQGRGSLADRAWSKYRRLILDSGSLMLELRDAGMHNENFTSPLGDQWPKEIRTIYESLGVPGKGLNEVWPTVAAATGTEATNRFRPKFTGRDPEDQGLADAFNEAMNRIREAGDFDATSSAVFRQAMVQRVGVARYWADVWKSRTPDVQVRRCRLDQICISFHAEQTNIRDMGEISHGRWMTLSEFNDFHPEPKAEEIFNELRESGEGHHADFEGGNHADVWHGTVGVDVDGSGSRYYRRSTNEVFVVEFEWKERRPLHEIEIPGETVALWSQLQGGDSEPVPLPDDQDLGDDPSILLEVGALVAAAERQLKEAADQYQAEAEMAQSQGQPPPEPPQIAPRISRQVNRKGLMFFQTGYAEATGREYGRVWNLRAEKIFAATLVGNQVVKVMQRRDNFWSMIPLIAFQHDAPEGVKPFSMVDLLIPRQMWLNMFLATWLHTMATMSKSKGGLDLERMSTEDVARINQQEARGDRYIGIPGGKDAVFSMPKGELPEGITEAWQTMFELVPGGAGQSRYSTGSVETLARTAWRLVEQQISQANKVLAEAYGALKQFRRMEALKIASVICAYYSYEDFRRVAGQYGKHVPADVSLWWQFLDFDLSVGEEPVTRDSATALIEMLNQTAMWQFYAEINPIGLTEILAPLAGSRFTESTIAALKEREPEQMLQKLAETYGVDPGALQQAIESIAAEAQGSPNA